MVSFSWGGGFALEMGAQPIFRQYHMHATYYVPSGLVCVPDTDPGCTGTPYLTLHDVQTLAAAGNEVGGLTVLHVPLSKLPARRGAAGDLPGPGQPDPGGGRGSPISRTRSPT